MATLARIWLVYCLAAGLAVASPARAQASAGEPTRGHLVSAGWLQQHLGRADLLVLDASPTPVHRAQHIPGAVGVDLYRYGIRDVPPAEIERRLQSWGVSPGRKTVLYDEGGSMMASWLFFELLHAGVPAQDLLLLDGGLHQWRAHGGAVTKEPTPAPARGTFRVTGLHETLRVRLPEVLVASGDTQHQALVEALEPSSYFGERAFFDRGGHIPHAVMAPSTDFYNADKTFKSAEEIRRMMAYLGVRPEQQVHTYCGGGVAATVPFFALKFIAGYPKVRLYRESQLEWLRDERGLPFWTYGAPDLMRETRWLNTWGGKMMRMYGNAQISIVDVRPPEVFRRGHVPFAINVPAETFASHLSGNPGDTLRDPARLAEILAQAGVKATDEAVVVSEAGLDARAALAYLALQALGQQKVTVFVDSIDRWAELGFEVARPAVAVAGAASASRAAGAAGAAPTAPAATASVRPVAYAATPRQETFAAEAADAAALYPRIYVASGRNAPTKAPPGKVVHLPAAGLVDANGAPKAAKDIWKAFIKAGVPRYAEIVLFADDPADAAANHFIFKLMGFPDVRVLLR